MADPQNEFDSPWKQILEAYFPEFIAFFFPHIYPEIDWQRPPEFLDKELQQIAPAAELGVRLADKLVKLWRHDGEETWLLLHIEIQNQEDGQFAQRMFIYHYRIFDYYQRQVVSLAVLGDERATWRPGQYGYELFGCQLQFAFPVVKLVDYRSQWDALAYDRNPFATVVMAHLKTLDTNGDRRERKAWKIWLVKRLYDRGYSAMDVVNLTRFIDWLMTLPQELEALFWQDVLQFEEEKRMPYLMSLERMGEQRGEQRGAERERSLILRQLTRRVGELPDAIGGQITALSLEQLEGLGEALLDFSGLADLETWLAGLEP